MSDSNVVSIDSAASSTVHQTVPSVKASARIEQLRAELRELMGEARTAIEYLEIDFSDIESRLERAEDTITAIAEAADDAELRVNMMTART